MSDPTIDAIMAMSDEEILAEAERDGVDLDALRASGLAMLAVAKLRPTARHKAYYDELRAIDAAQGDALRAEAAALKAERRMTLRYLAPLALRYRLKLAALFTLLEDAGLVAAGTYDRIKGSNCVYADGSVKAFAPMRLLREHIIAHGMPDAAPGCEVTP